MLWWATRSERVEISETGSEKVRQRVGGEMGGGGGQRKSFYLIFVFQNLITFQELHRLYRNKMGTRKDSPCNWVRHHHLGSHAVS